MSLIIQYCENCGERVAPEDLDSGAALRFRNACYCAACQDLVVPRLMEDPAFREMLAAQKKEPTGPVVTRTRPTTVGRGRPGSANLAPNALDPTVTPRGRQAPSTREPTRTPPPARGGPSAPLVVGGVAGTVIVLVIVFLVLGRGRGPAPSTDGPRTVDLQPEPAEPMPGLAELRRRELEAARTDVVALERDRPAAHTEIIASWRALLELARGTDLESEATRGLARARTRCDAQAQRQFDELRGGASRLVGETKFDEALARWDAFDPRLKTAAWQTRIAAERARIIEARAGHLSLRFRRGKIPASPHVVQLVKPSRRIHWGSNKVGSWVVDDKGVMTGSNTKAAKNAFTWTTYPGQDGHERLLRDFYIGFDLRIEKGKLVLVGRIPRKSADGKGLYLAIDPATDAFETGRWYRAHLLMRGMQAQFWVDDAQTLTSIRTGFTMDHGAFGFRAVPGAVFAVRNMELRVLEDGPLYRAFKVDGPMPTGRIDVLSGTGLAGWLGRGKAGWVREGATLRARSGAKESSYIYTGDVRWRDCTLGFAVRGVRGQLGVHLRWFQTKSTAVYFKASTFPDRRRWYRIELEVRGDRLSYQIPELQIKHASSAPTGAGRIGFTLPPNGAAELRELTLTVTR